MKGQITAELRNSQAEVSAESCMKLNISITLKEDDLRMLKSLITIYYYMMMEKNYFAVVVREDLKGDCFRVEAAFKLEGKIVDIKALDSGFVNSCSVNVLAVWGHFHSGAHRRHVELLDQLDLTLILCNNS